MTEQVLQALSNENRRGERKRKRHQKGSDSKRQRAPSSSGIDSDSNEESSSDSDSSSSSESDSDDYDLLSDPTTSQIDAKLKNKIWQNKYVDFIKLLPKNDLALDKSLRLQSAGNSEFKFVASKPKKSTKSIEQWTSAFLKFLAVYSEKYPKQIPAVIKHGEIVRELASTSSIYVENLSSKGFHTKIEFHKDFATHSTKMENVLTISVNINTFVFSVEKHSIMHCTWGDKSNPRGANTSHQTKHPAIPQSK